MKAIQTGGYGIAKSDVRWVITVPAIWTEEAKNIMHYGQTGRTNGTRGAIA
jgi:hypothetical protein